MTAERRTELPVTSEQARIMLLERYVMMLTHRLSGHGIISSRDTADLVRTFSEGIEQRPFMVTMSGRMTDDEFEELKERFREAYAQSPFALLPYQTASATFPPAHEDELLDGTIMSAENALEQTLLFLTQAQVDESRTRMVLHAVVQAAHREILQLQAELRQRRIDQDPTPDTRQNA